MIQLIFVTGVLLAIMSLAFLGVPNSESVFELKSKAEKWFTTQQVKHNVVEIAGEVAVNQNDLISSQVRDKYLSNLHRSLIGKWKRDDGAIVWFSKNQITKSSHYYKEDVTEAYEVLSTNPTLNQITLGIGQSESKHQLEMQFFDEQKGMRSTRIGGDPIVMDLDNAPVTPESGNPQVEYTNYTYQYLNAIN
ncbi:MAG: hypothetical protein ACI9CF_000360 [Candidatus Omnitrophota bacterium]